MHQCVLLNSSSLNGAHQAESTFFLLVQLWKLQPIIIKAIVFITTLYSLFVRLLELNGFNPNLNNLGNTNRPINSQFGPNMLCRWKVQE